MYFGKWGGALPPKKENTVFGVFPRPHFLDFGKWATISLSGRRRRRKYFISSNVLTGKKKMFRTKKDASKQKRTMHLHERMSLSLRNPWIGILDHF